ncbi:hypothetical protein [Pseudocowpox virus]|uniref:Uncharacterized protein n=1 Tax=Pseudocowpox virus TaxID=129726 RepID=D3IZR0_9POXV|nr:hypothetical protein PCPV_gp115 [Pseudocowpox virus]ADC54014.1 hypothetical protein [Pseudocowpox virus]
MSHLQILTSFGQIYAPDEARLREIARDLGICTIQRAFGDMLYGYISFSQIPLTQVNMLMPDCYFAVNGNLLPCTEDFRLRLPATEISAAYLTSTGKTILCGKDFNIVTPSGFKPSMRLRDLSHVSALVEILEFYSETGEYNFILNPSAPFMLRLMEKENVCLFGSGWCIVDLRRLNVTI